MMNQPLSKDWSPIKDYRSSNKTLLQTSPKPKRNQSYKKRKPIFDVKLNKKLPKAIRLNQFHILFIPKQPKTLHKQHTLQVINYDFCGCQNIITPCSIIENTFLKNVSLEEIKNAYNNEVENIEKRKLGWNNQNALLMKRVFEKVPSQFPQFLASKLSHLVEVIGQYLIDNSQFECLMAIQYHAKSEYLTYYLYRDVKQLFSKFQQFCSHLQLQLKKCNASLINLQYSYNKKSGCKYFHKYIQSYYNSIGAIMVPLSCYSRFISEVYKNGEMFLIKFIIYFIINKQQEFIQGFLLLQENVYRYRNFMRELNFGEFIDAVI